MSTAAGDREQLTVRIPDRVPPGPTDHPWYELGDGPNLNFAGGHHYPFDTCVTAVAAMTRGGGQASSDQSVAGGAPYDRGVAHASPSPTPNPDAMKFTLDTTLPAMLNVTSADAAAGHRFAEAVFAVGGVASIFGVDDFVTVTRQPGCEWDPIVAAVVAAAASDL